MTSRYVIQALIVLSAATCMSLPAATATAIDLKEVWKESSGELASAVRAGAGFSFTYNGETVGPQVSGAWRRAAGDGDAAKTVLTHESGLMVIRETRLLPQFDAVEYKLVFKNTTAKALPPISAINALDLTFDESAFLGTCIVSSGGGMHDSFFPPRTYSLRDSCFPATLSSQFSAELSLGSEGGRSSNRNLPFFMIHNRVKHEGMFVAFGWSGQWSAAALYDTDKRNLVVRGRIPDLEIALEPGEEIQGPTILLGLYQGAVSEGSNRLRRLIRDAYTPKLAGRRFEPVATYNTWFDVGLKFNEPMLRALADGAAALDQEYYLLDAGWYAGTEGNINFGPGVGNWYQVDSAKLPNGLEPVAEHVRAKGLKFGMWFEPERVAQGSQLAHQHPDWVLWGPGKSSEPIWKDRYPDFYNRTYGLLDLGRPEVQQWVRDLLEHYIRDLDLKYLRWDFNLDPLAYWNANDKPGRRGITQLRHIQGFYAIVDWIRERYPDVILETCASGGRRIDLETVRRFHTAFISDHTVDPHIVQYHLFGIHQFLPGNYHYVQYLLPASEQQRAALADLGFQTRFAGALGIGGRVDLWPEESRRKARLHVATWKKLRRYLIEDYYPLSRQPDDLESWSGWQFQDPKDRSGFVQTFTTNTTEATHRFVLQGLEKNLRYRFTDAYGAGSFDMTGAEAMTRGLEMKQEPMSSRVLTYSPLP